MDKRSWRGDCKYNVELCLSVCLSVSPSIGLSVRLAYLTLQSFLMFFSLFFRFAFIQIHSAGGRRGETHTKYKKDKGSYMHTGERLSRPQGCS